MRGCLVGCQDRGRDRTAAAQLDRRVKRRVELVGTGYVVRDRKGNHAIAPRRSDARSFARKRLDGLVEGIACTVGLVFGLTHELELFVATVGIVLQGLFELIEMVFEAVFYGRRRHKSASKRDHAEAAYFARIMTIIIGNRRQPARRPFLIDGTIGSIVQVCSAVIATYRPCNIGIKLGRPHFVWDTWQ